MISDEKSHSVLFDVFFFMSSSQESSVSEFSGTLQCRSQEYAVDRGRGGHSYSWAQAGMGGPRLRWGTSLGPLAGDGGGPRGGCSQPSKACEQPHDPDCSRLALLICCPSDTGGWRYFGDRVLGQMDLLSGGILFLSDSFNIR